jgi:hypothetical protein
MAKSDLGSREKQEAGHWAALAGWPILASQAARFKD